MENMRELNREEMEQASGGNVNGQHYNIRYLKKYSYDYNEYYSHGFCPRCRLSLSGNLCDDCGIKWVLYT